MRPVSNDKWTVQHVRIPRLNQDGIDAVFRGEAEVPYPETLGVYTEDHYMIVWRGDAWPSVGDVLDGISFARNQMYIPVEDEEKDRYFALHNTKLAPGNTVFGVRIDS